MFLEQLARQNPRPLTVTEYDRQPWIAMPIEASETFAWLVRFSREKDDVASKRADEMIVAKLEAWLPPSGSWVH